MPVSGVVPVRGPFLGHVVEAGHVRHGDVPVVFDSRWEDRVELVFGDPAELVVPVGLVAILSELVAFLADSDRLFDGVASREER